VEQAGKCLQILLQELIKPGAGGSHLQSQLLRRQRSEGWQLEVSLGKQFARPYLEKVVQGVSPEFKIQYCPHPPKKLVKAPAKTDRLQTLRLVATGS
jgi:hypothetical protein